MYHGAQFAEYCFKQLKLRDLLDRAVMKGIITMSGATYMEHL